MLINLTNHPSGLWPEEQRQAALEKYDSIHDMSFPAVPAQAEVDHIRRLAEDYYVKIRQLAAGTTLAVHLMGEMTFTFLLVSKLLEAGIPCVASTTERTVLEEQDGRKTVQFRFVRFRDYVRF